MQFRVLVSLFVLFAFSSFPTFLHAQFQEPTKEELQMTADPKAPGAAAVYLYREETTDDQLHSQGPGESAHSTLTATCPRKFNRDLLYCS